MSCFHAELPCHAVAWAKINILVFVNKARRVCRSQPLKTTSSRQPRTTVYTRFRCWLLKTYCFISSRYFYGSVLFWRWNFLYNFEKFQSVAKLWSFPLNTYNYFANIFKLQGFTHFFLRNLTFQSLKNTTVNFALGQHVPKKGFVDFTNILIAWICKNGTFRIFYAKLYILHSVEGSTNRHNEIILGGDYKR